MTYDKDNIEFLPKPTRPNFIDIEGQTFHRLTVLGFVGLRRYQALWLCECECGTLLAVPSYPLRTGHTKSCGCLKNEIIRTQSVTHGMTRTPEYQSYYHAKYRCDDKNDAAYSFYGGRGIEFRFESFEHFLEHIGTRPSPAHSLDRIDNNGHYEPGNVRWATKQEQMVNRRNTRWFTYNGKTQTLSAWAQECEVVCPKTFKNRIRTGWEFEHAFTAPLHSPRHLL